MRFARRLAGVAVLALLVMSLGATPAFASFHEMWIREVYPGSAAQPEAEYVELQMWASGQNFVNGHAIAFYNATGGSIGSATFSGDVSNGANQATILAATPAAESAFGVTADLGLAPNLIDPTGGAVCWETFDCVAWGNFSGGAKFAAGSPAAPGGIPDGRALRRSIARSCASLLEASDDRDNSAGDFDLVFPAPRPNSVVPSERPCGTAGGGGGGEQAGAAPQTQLGKKPPRKTKDRTPTFRFTASDDSAGFQCKLDGGKFKACRSPFTTRKLAFGRHTFSVRAMDASGDLDASPATYRFTVFKKK